MAFDYLKVSNRQTHFHQKFAFENQQPSSRFEQKQRTFDQSIRNLKQNYNFYLNSTNFSKFFIHSGDLSYNLSFMHKLSPPLL